MGICYELSPIDTLFFKGSEPLVAGQTVADSVFPPPVSVIKGALRTAYLKQYNISFEDYKKGNVAQEVLDNVGYCGKEAPFNVKAILIKSNDKIYVPVPLNWFLDISKEDKDSLLKGKDIDKNKAKIIKTENKEEIINKLGMQTSHTNIPIAQITEFTADPESISGKWISLDSFKSKQIDKKSIVSESEFVLIEYRTGVELDLSKRQTKEGQLYSAGHLRFKPNTTILIVLDKEIKLKDNEILTLGGEKRLVTYKKVEVPNLNVENSTNKEFVSFAPIELTQDNINDVIATYKPKILAGWDMAKGFHKPTTTWLSAGTVFSKNINNQCIAL